MLPGIGFTSASCSAYMIMNGVISAAVSAGSSQRVASVTWTPHVIVPAGWAAAGAASRSSSDRARIARPGWIMSGITVGGEHRRRHLLRRRRPALVGCERLAVAVDARDGGLQPLGLGGEPEMLEHQRGGQQRARRVRDAAARDVRRGAVHRLEVHPATVTEVGRGIYAQPTRALAGVGRQ